MPEKKKKKKKNRRIWGGSSVVDAKSLVIMSWPTPDWDSGSQFCTDGSLIEDSSGFGWVEVEKEGIKTAESRHLEDGTTVFQAEVRAILSVAKFIKKNEDKYSKVVIHCDSQAAILAIANPKVDSKL